MRHLVTAGILLATAAPIAAQDFEWRGRIARGKWLEVKGVNGDVRAIGAAGPEAQVTAVKRSRRGDPGSVEIKVLEHDDGVTICALYPTPPGAREENRCEPGDRGHMSTRDNDVTVHFTVQVPAGVKFRVRTVNGEIDADGLSADAEVATVNGSVRVATTGLARAQTVNGSIHATLGRADWPDELDFHTVNGGITLTLPAEVHTEIRAQTVNGDIESDWPVTVRGRFGPKRVTGTIGSGGRTLHLETVNGSIRLKRGA